MVSIPCSIHNTHLTIVYSSETQIAIPNPNHKNWSGEVIPTPMSLVKPVPIRGFQPSHLVILAGKEVGIFAL